MRDIQIKVGIHIIHLYNINHKHVALTTQECVKREIFNHIYMQAGNTDLPEDAVISKKSQ